jgi:hypothetical protein
VNDATENLLYAISHEAALLDADHIVVELTDEGVGPFSWNGPFQDVLEATQYAEWAKAQVTTEIGDSDTKITYRLIPVHNPDPCYK